jgi:hypothetical protein
MSATLKHGIARVQANETAGLFCIRTQLLKLPADTRHRNALRAIVSSNVRPTSVIILVVVRY